MTREEYLLELLSGFFPWLWDLTWTAGTWIVYTFAVLVTLMMTIQGWIYLWRHISEEGKIIPEKRLPYGFYRVLAVTSCDGYEVAIVVNSKGELIACKSEQGAGFKSFAIIGEHPDQFFVPKEKEQSIKSSLGHVP